MNSDAIEWARNQRLGDSCAKAVLVDLAGQADKSGFLVCALEEIAQSTCMSARTVQRKLRWLETAGFVGIYRGADCLAFQLRMDKSFELDSARSGLPGAD
jgi:pyocin large subunit-like protein